MHATIPKGSTGYEQYAVPFFVNFFVVIFLDRRSFIDPICCNSCMVLSMLLWWFWPIFLFSLRDINLTLGLLPPRHVVWRDSVGVESSGSGLKIRVCGYFASEQS